jgi:hypothetical protein
VQLSPPPPDASTRPEAHHVVQATYPHLYSAPPRGAPNPSQPGVLLPIPAIGDVRGEEWGEGGGEPSEGAPSVTKTGAVREEEPTRRSRAPLRPLRPRVPPLRIALHRVEHLFADSFIVGSPLDRR